MRSIKDDTGSEWIADAREEETPRHHGRWYMVFRRADGDTEYPLPEFRWQTYDTAERTIRTMSEFELRRRLLGAGARRTAQAIGG